MINVLFIGMTSNPGGLETYMINIFSRLEGHGFHFTFLNIRKNDIAYSQFIRSHGGSIIQDVIEGIKFKHLRRMYRAKEFFRNYHNYDIIHLNTTYLNQIYWIKAAKKYHIKNLIIQSHNCGFVYNSRLFHLLSVSLDRYNKIYLKFHPNIVKLAASNECGIWMFGNNSKFMVINNGIDTNRYIYNYKYRILLKHRLNLKPYNKVIITTARIEPQKNYTKIIRVFKKIHNSDNNIKLVIIGIGKEIHMIKSMVNNYNLNNDVYFLGRMGKSNVAKYLNIADLMLMPSLYEAIPFSLTEAQASGVPSIVSSRISSKADVTGKIWYISLNKNDEYWANASISILNRPLSISDKFKMNESVKHSNLSLVSSINQIKLVYLQMINH